MTIVGTRPEIIRLSQVIKLCDKNFDHKLIHTGQNYDYTLSEIFFKELNVPQPDYFLDSVGKNLGETLGNIISNSYSVMEKETPDAVLILGDTNSALSAISAKRLKIPIFHMEAGNRCFDENVPEEINRKIVDHISEINMPYTEHSRRYLLDEGIDKKHIFVTGSPMPEVIEYHKQDIEKSDVLEQLKLTSKKYFIVSSHREENIDNEPNFISLMESLNDVAETYKMPIIFSTHPRTSKWIEKRKFKLHSLIKNVQPLGFLDYNKLQMESACVLSDSGTLSEESAILGFSGVLLRTSTERPEVLDKGRIIIGGIKKDSIKQSINIAMNMPNLDRPLPGDYCDLNVSEKVVKIIQSYTGLVSKRNG